MLTCPHVFLRPSVKLKFMLHLHAFLPSIDFFLLFYFQDKEEAEKKLLGRDSTPPSPTKAIPVIL